jgi:hypothetical protein
MLKKILAAALVLLSGVVAGSEPVRVLGFAVGSETLAEVRARLEREGVRFESDGTNLYSRGPMLVARGNAFNVDGLERTLLIFDAEDRLAAVVLTLGRARYDGILSVLKGRYRLLDEKKAFVGDRHARFRAGDVEILLDSPHMSFEMTVVYATRGFWDSYHAIRRAQAEEKRRREEAQF